LKGNRAAALRDKVAGLRVEAVQAVAVMAADQAVADLRVEVVRADRVDLRTSILQPGIVST
jgi:hypothetical protein